MKYFRTFYGSWPEWFGDVDGGTILYIRIRHGDVYIGEAASEDEATATSQLVKESETYCGISEALDALRELQEAGYYYVPPVKKVIIE